MSRGVHGGRKWRGSRGVGRAATLGTALTALVATSLLTVAGPAAGSGLGARVATRLGPGQTLAAKSFLSSPDGRFRLNMQRDGNLVLYQHFGSNKAIWQTGTGGHPGAYAVMQKDGNFVLYAGSHPIWSTGTSQPADAGAHLFVQDNARVDIYSTARKKLWTTYKPPRVPPLPYLGYGATGPNVVMLQQQLSALGYWVGPSDGVFGDSTEQALWALQKAAGLPRTGVLDSATDAALVKGVRPAIRPASGNLIEVNLSDDLLMIIQNGKLYAVLNTSTGGGYTYVEQGQTDTAITPQGIFHTYAVINGTDTDPLGTLWRPRFFYEGYAIHGDSYVPPEPVSHGCVRVSNEAIDWIWSANLDPIGTEVWIFS